jgi:hypothetical protein
MYLSCGIRNMTRIKILNMFNLIKQGIMKRVFNLKSILAIAFTMLLAGGLFAQTPVPGYDNGAGGNNYDNATPTYVSVGKTVPLYASPSAYYHPTYDPKTGNGITAGFTWVWTVPVGAGNATLAGGVANYIQVTGVNAGTSSTVHVVENAPPAWGGCTDAGQDLVVNVVALPTIAWAAGLNASYNVCAGDPSLPGAIGTVISGGWQNYRLAWTLQIKTLNADLSDHFFYATDKVTQPTPLAVNWTQAVPEAVAASGAHDITSIAGGFTVINARTTVYTYTLNGLNDQASRYGDFLTLAGGAGVNGVPAASFSYYDTAAKTITITIHPAPTTGPIFHIVGTWAQ